MIIKDALDEAENGVKNDLLDTFAPRFCSFPGMGRRGCHDRTRDRNQQSACASPSDSAEVYEDNCKFRSPRVSLQDLGTHTQG